MIGTLIEREGKCLQANVFVGIFQNIVYMKKDELKKEFYKEISMFNHKYPTWAIWNDFLYMSAISIANSVPVKERQEREELYLKIVAKYNKAELNAFVNMLRILIDALEVCPEQDFLGEMYHALNLQQNQKGQFFTPYDICELMSEMQIEHNIRLLEDRDYITVNDPACGAGATLIAFANVALKHKVNYQQKILFVAQDIDLTATLMCYLQLSLLGCNAVVIRGDSLAKPGLHKDNDIWITPMYFINQWRFRDFWKQNKALEVEKESKAPETEKNILTDEVTLTSGAAMPFDFKVNKNGQLQLNLW